MRRLAPSAALLFLGCDPQSTIGLEGHHSWGVTILGVSRVRAEVDPITGRVVSCTHEASASEFTREVSMDTAHATAMRLPLTVRNDSPSADLVVRPLRFHAIWDCPPEPVTDWGPLVLPAFDFERPFCEVQTQAMAEFIGFDPTARPPTPLLGGGALGVVEVPAIPPALGSALDQTFRLAALAERCCFDTRASNCNGDVSAASCAELAEIFAALDPSGTDLQVSVPEGPSEDLLRFQAFSVFNGTNLCARDRTLCDSSRVVGPKYPMHVLGWLELVGPDGHLLESNRAELEIGICRSCGPGEEAGSGPWPTPETQCFSRP